jgi:hypothetical protein
MSNFAMYSYSWDLAENGVAKSVEEFKNLGINSVTLASSYHAGKFLRPKSKTNKVYFPEDGTVYFKSDSAKYGEIKPIPNSIYGDGKVLHELTDTKGISVSAWLVLLHNTQLGTKHQGSAVHNAFGDPYLYALCPSAPAARAYAIGLCKDVTESYKVEGISIESIGFPPYEHGFHHEMSFVKPNKWLSQGLGLCFCTHCLAGAEKTNIDAKALQARVARNIHNYLESDIDYEHDMADALWLADIASDPDLQKFLQFRSGVVTSLAKEIRESVRKDVEIAIIPSVARPTGGAWYEGTDLKAIAETTGVIEACFYEPTIDRIKGDLADIQIRTEGIGKIKGILRPAFPDLTSEDAVVGAVSALWNGGVKDIGFYNYGHIRSQSLQWIGKALAMVNKK